MKKRIFALLLCVVMLASMIPLMGASVSDNGGTGTVAVSTATADVSEDSKAVITAAGGDGAYQWQIYAGNDVWANIAGQTGAQLTVSYGMVCGLMDGRKAYVRCRVTNGENEAYSSPVEIGIAGNEEENSGGNALFALFAPSPVAVDEPVGTVAADEPVGTVVREAYVLGEPVITLPGAATPAPTATPAAEATPAPAEDTDEAPAEEPTPAPDAEAPAEDGAEAEPSPAPTEEAAPSASPAAETAPAETPAAAAAPVAEAAEENTAAPAQDAEAAPTAARSISAPALRLAPLRRFSSVDTNDPAETDAPAATPDTYYITINYVYGDEENAGKQAANPWTANIAAGSSYSATVVSPAIVGYAPDQATFTVDEKNIDRNVTYTVYYYPSKVNYTVCHYQQNTDNDGYTLVETEPKTGLTNAKVGGDLARDYKGFYSLLYDGTVRIAADGSTVIDIKYDRYYYLLNFDLDGGYGVEPIYARYGAPVSVGTPTKAGYTFAGWDQEPPATVPAGNLTFKANWTIGDQAKVTVVIWGENADDEKYSFYGNSEIQAKPGTTLTKDDLTHILICEKEEHNHEAAGCTLACSHVHTLTCYGLSANASSTNPNSNKAWWNESDPEAYFSQLGLEDGYLYYDDENAKYDSKDNYYLRLNGAYYKLSTNQFNALKGEEAGKTSDNTRKYPDYYYKYKVNTGSISCTHTHSDACYTCGKEAHTHGESCYTSPLDMDATLWTLVKSDEITVAADGTSIINVYYDRVEFTLHFRNKNSNSDNYGTITAKWGANIRDAFNAKGTSAGTYNWSQKSNADGPWTSYLDIMPTENRWYYANKDYSDTSTAQYYVEGLDGKDKLFYTSTASGTGLIVTKEEFIEIPGFTFDAARSTQTGAKFNGAKFYYTRNSYTLKFYNYNGEVTDKSTTVKYEAPLGSYNFTPDYPAGLEPNAYEFAGWYTTAGCYAGSEADLSAMTMPASDLILYAKWAPKTHKVTTWLTVDMKDAVNVGTTDSNVQTVPHGGKAEAPATPTRGDYVFVGWFYKENGTEKAFDFSMPVNRDLDLYAKWSSNTLKEYTIKYQLEDGTTIAPDTTGSALAETTKTFDAKTGDELNEGYRSGYYPLTNSHSMVMNIDGGNEFIFYYVAKEKVPYTVKYLEKGTNKELLASKTENTTAAVVTETFVPIAGYRPDAYQKRLVLSATESKNVIIFYYEKDELHAPVQVIHWTQNIAGDGYTEYQSSTNLDGVIGEDYSETPLTIPGFEYNANPAKQVDGYPAQASGTLTAAGLVLNFYYDRIEYPYEFRFVEKASDPEKQLADSVTGSARYQAQVTQTAKTIPGYTLASADSQSIIIDIEDGTTAVKNVKTFYYTEQTVDIKYEVVGPAGCGTLDNYQENQLKVINGDVKGSLPTAAKGFKFVGWFKDEACNNAVDEEWVKDNKLTPEKTKNYGTDEKPIMGYEDATYYAKFEYDVADLTITKQGCADIDENQSFIFNVTGPDGYSTRVAIKGNGSVTITGLKIGDYTVTEETGWSWRYTPSGSGQTITLQPTGENVVAFANSRTGLKWLGGDAYNQNIFGG